MNDGLRVVLKRLDPALYKLPVKCDFCNDTSQDELLYGKIHTLDNINVHYYCLLFACNLRQNGKDDEGILGFLPNDIRTEIRRSQKETCSYCLKPGATIICVQRMCKKVFHLPCGVRNGSIHHFFKIFQSFCKAHRPQQKVPQYQLMLPEAPICAICLESVKRDPKSRNVLWAPCCKVNAWLHRACVQKLALHAGYFFKCPRCNNKPEFTKAMLTCGIYIPEKDASWELEPNAFEELTERYSYCDKEKCICPKGRDYDVDDTEWEVILCEGCGSQGIHLGCLGAPPKSRRTWCCQVCSDVLTHKEPAPSTSNVTEPAAAAASAAATCSEVGLSVEDRRQGAQLKRVASEWVHTSEDSNSSSSCPNEIETEETLARRRRTSRWTTDPILARSTFQDSSSSSEIEENEEDVDVEVVDVEEDNKPPVKLTTRDGTSIPIVFLAEEDEKKESQVQESEQWTLEETDTVESFPEAVLYPESESTTAVQSNSDDSSDVIVLD